MKVIAALSIFGLVASIVGGAIAYDSWFRVGALIFSTGLLVLYLMNIWKAPSEFVESTMADGPIENEAQSSIRQAETEPQSKNGGKNPALAESKQA